MGFLNVVVPADITKITGADPVLEGGVARLVCETRGYPQPQVYWTRGDRTQTITMWDAEAGLKREGE